MASSGPPPYPPPLPPTHTHTHSPSLPPTHHPRAHLQGQVLQLPGHHRGAEVHQEERGWHAGLVALQLLLMAAALLPGMQLHACSSAPRGGRWPRCAAHAMPAVPGHTCTTGMPLLKLLTLPAACHLPAAAQQGGRGGPQPSCCSCCCHDEGGLSCREQPGQGQEAAARALLAAGRSRRS